MVVTTWCHLKITSWWSIWIDILRSTVTAARIKWWTFIFHYGCTWEKKMGSKIHQWWSLVDMNGIFTCFIWIQIVKERFAIAQYQWAHHETKQHHTWPSHVHHCADKSEFVCGCKHIVWKNKDKQVKYYYFHFFRRNISVFSILIVHLKLIGKFGKNHCAMFFAN